jgi:hypothetical protein
VAVDEKGNPDQFWQNIRAPLYLREPRFSPIKREWRIERVPAFEVIL